MRAALRDFHAAELRAALRDFKAAPGEQDRTSKLRAALGNWKESSGGVAGTPEAGAVRGACYGNFASLPGARGLRRCCFSRLEL